MHRDPAFHVTRLGPEELRAMHGLLTLFGKAFDDEASYGSARPRDAYLVERLSDPTFFALVAQKGSEVVGGLAAYELKKFEQERSEIYLYDLAVAADHRREGIATALIEVLCGLAAKRGAYVVFVQADLGDDPAIALYTKLGAREEVLHFDIEVPGRNEP